MTEKEAPERPFRAYYSVIIQLTEELSIILASALSFSGQIPYAYIVSSGGSCYAHFYDNCIGFTVVIQAHFHHIFTTLAVFRLLRWLWHKLLVLLRLKSGRCLLFTYTQWRKDMDKICNLCLKVQDWGLKVFFLWHSCLVEKLQTTC